MGGSHFSSQGVWSTLPIFALPQCCALGCGQAASHWGGSFLLSPDPRTYSSPRFGFLPPSQHHSCAQFWLTTLSQSWHFCLEQDSSSSDIIFLSWYERYQSQFCCLAPTQHGPQGDPSEALYWPRSPLGGKTLVRSSSWTDQLMYRPRMTLTTAGLRIGGEFSLPISYGCCILIKAATDIDRHSEFTWW